MLAVEMFLILRSRIGEVIIYKFNKINMSEISEIHIALLLNSLFEVVVDFDSSFLLPTEGCVFIFSKHVTQ